MSMQVALRKLKEMKLHTQPLADPGGGAPGAPPPPNGRGPMIFFMPKTLIFLNFFFARFARDSF